jgi:beta-galactosidase
MPTKIPSIKSLGFDAIGLAILFCFGLIAANNLEAAGSAASPQWQRERILLDEGWRFYKYASAAQADQLIYEVRPQVTDVQDGQPADAKPTAAEVVQAQQEVLKPWILPTANPFIQDAALHHKRPKGSPGEKFPLVQSTFDDSTWETVRVPHDWAIAGPFMAGEKSEVGGGMGRLPSPGVAWYRKRLDIPNSDAGRSIFLDVDGAMSYAMVWLNGHLVGGWPYGYASWRLDLTPYIEPGGKNLLAIRLDNPPHSSRWYPGGGLYRNVWLTKTHPVHVAHWGTYVTTPEITRTHALANFKISLENQSERDAALEVTTDIYKLDGQGIKVRGLIARIAPHALTLPAGSATLVESAAVIPNPSLWGPPPNQQPNLYVAETFIKQGDVVIDQYESRFGIRKLRLDAERGLFVNDEHIYIQGVNHHHDLGALGAAFNYRAAERQLQMLQEMGVNAIRMAHNPPAPELLELTDRMGFLVVNEIFDSWAMKKTPLDFHRIYPDWSEADLRAFIRRDRNHPSVIIWGVGNEVGEQYTEQAGAEVARRLQRIAEEEDPTRATAVAMNYAKPQMPLPAVMDTISLNYQGEGIRDAPAYADLEGIRTPPQYPAFRKRYPDKLIFSSENAAAVSSRGEYLFPVTPEISAPVRDGLGGDPKSLQVSSYELYTAPFGASADKVFASQEQHPFVAGGFVWSGWDYLGEPTPYYQARSSYFGVIDLAGFKKDRFYLYQSHWRPDEPNAHILPHWTWPERVGQVTPVHVFTSGDEAELFLNGKSLGRKKKGKFEYRLRWDDVEYSPGELKVVAYKKGAEWVTNAVHTSGAATGLQALPDRSAIRPDGLDLSFITIKVVDKDGHLVPRAKNHLKFILEGPGEIVATDNGDAASLVSFKSHERNAFNGLCLVIVRAKPGQEGNIKIKVAAEGLVMGEAIIAAGQNLAPRVSPTSEAEE